MSDLKIGDKVIILRDDFPCSRGEGTLTGTITRVNLNTVDIQTKDWYSNGKWNFEKVNVVKETKLHKALR